ncbi:hypothetical protein J6590_095012 [Homalodisca vitripennis]|nr:hypothetical protein J6590_095012 [Homalodisca vitripennis]
MERKRIARAIKAHRSSHANQTTAPRRAASKPQARIRSSYAKFYYSVSKSPEPDYIETAQTSSARGLSPVTTGHSPQGKT